MTVRYPSQCRRGVSRAAGSGQGIWVSDSMLREAIEQYHHGARFQCRSMTSHKGPLESKRRIGKRHMTAFVPSTATFPSPWHFQVIPSTTTWLWEAPTTPESRRMKSRDVSISGAWNGFIGWLEKSDADKPYLTLPGTHAATAVPPGIGQLRTAIMALEYATEEQIMSLVDACREAVRTDIGQGIMSAENLNDFMNPIDTITSQHIGDHHLEDKIVARIRRAVTSSIKWDNVPMSRAIWMSIGSILCASPATHSNIHLFTRIMHIMPQVASEEMAAEDIVKFCKSFVTEQALRNTHTSNWSISARRLGSALSKLSTIHQATIQAEMNTYLSSTPLDLDTLERQRFAWTMAGAHMTSISSVDFAQHALSFLNMDKLQSKQIWQLMRARLTATGVIPRDSDLFQTDGKKMHMASRWKLLIQAAAESPRGISELHDCLTSIGASDMVIQDLTSAPRTHMPYAAIRTYAKECGDYNFAITFYDAACQGGHAAGPWKYSDWINYVEVMINDPAVEPRVFRLLNLKPRASYDVERARGTTTAASKMALLDRMAICFSEAKHLNERQLLRRLESCALLQRELTGAISPTMLSKLTDTITMDLSNGKRGRTTRLEWLLQTIQDTYGDERGHDAVKALKGWRRFVEQTTSDAK